ncbi:MAG: carboxypeptidase M32 [Gemmatimonadaceae bacterium]
MNPELAYADLIRRSRDRTVLASCLGLLIWDQEVCMPRAGVAHRSEQSALLAGLIHDRGTDPVFDELLTTVEGSSLVSDPDSPEAVNVRELRRDYDRERRIPRKLAEELARVHAFAAQSWAEARANNDYKSFAPWLEKVFVLAREEADAVGYVTERYDALLDNFEPGMTSDHVSVLFKQLEMQLVPMVAELRGKSDTAPNPLAGREFPVDTQKQFFDRVATSLGFDLESGRFDVVQHPFCSMIGTGDIRIGMRYFPQNFAGGFFALVHEVGHGLYDQGLQAEHYGTPMGDAVSLGIHESQSRLWENYVGRSLGFWRHFYPQLQNEFPDALHDISLDTFRRSVNRVSPGLIRVQADELTYNLHIMIRFELERALLSGDLSAPDLPGAWNELYEQRLGIRPKDDTTGCLQDVHWADGLIAYFPTYTLGNVYAAQLFAAAERAIGPLEEEFSAGDFGALRSWLGENIHRHGRHYKPAELVERATGSAPDPSALIESLSRRYKSDQLHP